MGIISDDGFKYSPEGAKFVADVEKDHAQVERLKAECDAADAEILGVDLTSAVPSDLVIRRQKNRDKRVAALQLEMKLFQRIVGLWKGVRSKERHANHDALLLRLSEARRKVGRDLARIGFVDVIVEVPPDSGGIFPDFVGMHPAVVALQNELRYAFQLIHETFDIGLWNRKLAAVENELRELLKRAA